MPIRKASLSVAAAAALLALCMPANKGIAADGDVPSEAVAVAKTFDGTPFAYHENLIAQRAGYRVYRLTYPSPVATPLPENNTIPADYYLPDGIDAGDPPRPAVICLHILAGNYELVHMTCAVLATRGIPAIMFKLPYYGERAPVGGTRALADNPQLFISAVDQARADVRRTVDLLASRREVDPSRIGITGISLGGIVAASAAGAEPRIARAALILAGGDLSKIIHHARETRELSAMIRALPENQQVELQQKLAAVDPLCAAEQLQSRAQAGKVLMINAAEDEVIPRDCTERLAAALGISDRVVWLDGLGHYTAMAVLPQALNRTADFFAQDLPPGVQPAEAAVQRQTPQQRIAGVLLQVGQMIGADPQPGRGHMLDAAAEATLPDGQQLAVALRYLRGPDGRFVLHGDVSKLGVATLGQGSFPWMAPNAATVFAGVLPAEKQPGDPLKFAEEKHVMKLRMLSGGLAAVALAPELLDTWVSFDEETTPEGQVAVRLVGRRDRRDRMQVVFQSDGVTPQRISFDVRGTRGEVKVRVWQRDAVAGAAMFEPPDDANRQEVDAEDLYRMFSAMFNFAMESMP